MRLPAALAVVVALGACSGETGGWKRHTLADGRLSFEMPGSPGNSRSETKSGEDALEEESATWAGEGLDYTVSVTTGRPFAKRMGTTEKQHLRWAGFHLLGIIQQYGERTIVDEGQWNQGKLVGKWMQVALPEKPPERTVPIYRWLYAAAWEGRAVVVSFDATQAAYDDEARGSETEQARERFVTSVAVE